MQFDDVILEPIHFQVDAILKKISWKIPYLYYLIYSSIENLLKISFYLDCFVRKVV